MALSLGSHEKHWSHMLNVGDLVMYVKDGVKGVVMAVESDRCHVMWEDTFCSWERADLLTKQNALD